MNLKQFLLEKTYDVEDFVDYVIDKRVFPKIKKELLGSATEYTHWVITNEFKNINRIRDANLDDFFKKYNLMVLLEAYVAFAPKGIKANSSGETFIQEVTKERKDKIFRIEIKMQLIASKENLDPEKLRSDAKRVLAHEISHVIDSILGKFHYTGKRDVAFDPSKIYKYLKGQSEFNARINEFKHTVNKNKTEFDKIKTRKELLDYFYRETETEPGLKFLDKNQKKQLNVRVLKRLAREELFPKGIK